MDINKLKRRNQIILFFLNDKYIMEFSKKIMEGIDKLHFIPYNTIHSISMYAELIINLFVAMQ